MSRSINFPFAARWQLLSTASAIALLASTYGGKAVAADSEADKPTVWVELGGQAQNVSGQGEPFAPDFLSENSTSSVLQKITPLQAQNPPKFSFGEEGKISIQPDDTDWVFSAGLQYGRSGGLRHVHHQTYRTFVDKYKSGVPNQSSNTRAIDKFSDTKADRHESHLVLDFSAGKDVGVGLFGQDSTSVFSFGVRFAQLSSKTSVDIRARPNVHFKYQNLAAFGHPSVDFQLPYYQTYHATGQAKRSFHGVGPALSWNGSAPFAGNAQSSELTFDWGANLALLFGRQKAHVQHQESEHYVNPRFVFTGQRYTGYVHPLTGHDTDRSVAVPNVGGSLGLSWRILNFKASFGYRADFFFGAMDTGIDARKSQTIGLYGPFATISVGLP